MNKRVLLVDDDPNILAGYKRQMRKVLAMETAESGAQALKIMAQGDPFAVICSDLRMPGMDGLEFLSRARKLSPDTVRMMLTGNADINSAIESVNEGNIFRFLTKPCKPTTLAQALADGIRQYHLITGERELLNKTLRGSIEILTDILSLVNPKAFGRASRIADYVKRVVSRMGLESSWEYETAALLSQIGCITLPEEIIDKVSKGKVLRPEEQALYEEHPHVASELISKLPRLGKISEMVGLQNENLERTGVDESAQRDLTVSLGSRILRAVIDLDNLISSGQAKGRALLNLKTVPGEYDPAVLAALEGVLGAEAKYDIANVGIHALEEGMMVAEDVVSRDEHRTLLAKGQRLSQTTVKYLLNYNTLYGVKDPLKVWVPLSG